MIAKKPLFSGYEHPPTILNPHKKLDNESQVIIV